MNEFTKKQTEELLRKLDAINRISQSPILAHEQRSDLILSCVEKVSETLETYRFETQEEEIVFFKSTLPPLICLSKYYYEMYELESLKMLTSEKSHQQYRDKLMDKMDKFFTGDAEFILYCQSGRTDMDSRYFLRSSILNRFEKEMSIMPEDYAFCPAYTMILAFSLAYKNLRTDLCLERRVDAQAEYALAEKLPLGWTFPKIDLIELIYSLKEMGVFNDGKATLKQIVQFFEEAFSIKLGNVTKAFQDIKNRKSDKPLFLDRAKAALNKAIDRDFRNDFCNNQNGDNSRAA